MTTLKCPALVYFCAGSIWRSNVLLLFISIIYFMQYLVFQFGQNVDLNGTLYPVYKQLHTFSLNLFQFWNVFVFINRLQVSLTTMQTIFLIHSMFARLCKQFFSIFSISSPLQKNIGPSLKPLGKKRKGSGQKKQWQGKGWGPETYSKSMGLYDLFCAEKNVLQFVLLSWSELQ